MARPRAHLRNAPIVEAVIDFRVSPGDGCSADTFAHLNSSIGARYTQKAPIRLIQGGFGFDKGELLPPAVSQKDIGWRYQAETEVAQFRLDGRRDFQFSFGARLLSPAGIRGTQTHRQAVQKRLARSQRHWPPRRGQLPRGPRRPSTLLDLRVGRPRLRRWTGEPHRFVDPVLVREPRSGGTPPRARRR